MPRRGENIFKRKDGRWEGRYKVQRIGEGKTFYRSVYAHSYNDVKQKLAEKKAETAQPQKVYMNPILFETLAEQWLNSVSISAKESTIVKYRNLLDKHIINRFGNMEVTNITTLDIDIFVQQKLSSGRLDGKGGLSAKSVADIVSVMKEVLRYGKKNGMDILCQSITVPSKKEKPVLPVYGNENREKLEKYLIQSTDLRDMGILICMYTGLRIGEICALRWENINLSEGIIRVYFTMQRVQDMSANAEHKTKIVVTAPKSQSSVREIPIPEFLVSVLKNVEAADPNAYFLTGKAGAYIEPRNYQYYYKKLLESNSIPYLNFHSLRHTFATRCIEAGVDAKTLSDILGHSKVNITLDRYVHVTMDMKRSGIKKLMTPSFY